MKRFAIILFTICALFIHPLRAQKQGQARIDSLLEAVATSKEDTNKVNALNDLSRFAGWQVGNYDTALYYANAAKTLAEKLSYESGIATSYSNIGLVYQNQGNYPQTLKNHFASLKISERIGDKKGIASSYNNIGTVYRLQGNYPEALKNYFASLKIREQIGDKKGSAGSYNNIGNVYLNQGNYSEALTNYFAAQKFWQEIGEKQKIAGAYNNIGNIYRYQGNYTEALKNHFASLKLREELKDKKGIADSYMNVGNVYSSQGNHAEALKNFFTSLEIGEEIGDKSGIAINFNNIGNVYLITGKAAEAKVWQKKSLELSQELGDKDGIKESYEGLAAADSALGDFKSAFEHHKLYLLYRDSLINEENTKKSVQAQMQYEFDKKEATANAEHQAELNKQKLVRNGFVGGFVVVLLFAGVFFTQRNTIKKGKKRSDELLLNILPSEVAEELKLNGSSEAKQFDEVTVMFTDFKDFTLLSENLSPAELVTKIDYCYKAFDKIMEKYHIEKIKTIGDSYMAAGGLHFRNKTNVTDVVKAALEIQQFMEADAQQKRNTGKEVMEIRIGIHTGTVVAGIVGIKKFAYDIWGDTVNIASRMERSSEPGKVNISGATYELVKDKFKCEYRGKISAKNKGEIDMYFVENIL